MLEYRGILINKLIYMSWNNETAHLEPKVREFLEKVPSWTKIEQADTRKFLNFLETKYPGWSWQNHDIMKAEVDLFLNKLGSMKENWALQAKQEIQDSKTEISNLASTVNGTNTSNWSSLEVTSSNIKKLDNISETSSSAKKLFQEIVGRTPSKENIEAFQTSHGIGIDGVIWIETFGELQAHRLKNKLKTESRDNYISNELQKEILLLLSYANEKWKNREELFIAVAFSLWQIREKIDSDEFNRLYWDFYEKFDSAVAMNTQNPENEAEAMREWNKKNKSGGSFFWDLTKMFDGDMTWQEVWERNKGTATIAWIAGFVFFGNKIPWFEKIPGMGNWFTRILWLIGWIALWGKDLLEWGADKVADGISSGSDYVKSDAFQADMDKWKKWFNDTWNTMTSAETYNIWVETAQDIFGYTLSSMNSLNKSFQEWEWGKFIEQFSGKSMLIMSDKSFLHATKDQITSVETLEDLRALMSPGKFEELKKIEPTMTDAEVKSFIDNHMRKQLENVEDGDMLKKSIWYRHAQSALEWLTFNESGSLNTNPKIDSYLKNEFATIINGRGSETLKEAARKLAAATQNWKINTFNLNEDFASLSKEDTAIIEALYNKIQAIWKVQWYISKHIAQVQAIEVKTEGIPDNEDTLKKDMDDLIALENWFVLNAKQVADSWINQEDFDRSSFDAAINAKRMEILTYADSIWMTSITGVASVKDELWKVEKEQKQLLLESEILSQIDEITPLPSDWSSLIDLRKWWEDNSSTFKQLEDSKSDIDAGNTQIIEKIEQTLTIKTNFISLLSSTLEGISWKLTELEKKVDAIKTDTTDPESYRAARVELASIVQEYNTTIATVIPSWDQEITSDVWSFFESIMNGDFANAFTKNTTNNSLDYFQSQTGLWALKDVDIKNLERKIKAVIRTLESNLDITLDIGSIDVSDVSTLDTLKASIEKINTILWMVVDPEVKEEVFAKLSNEIKKVEWVFISAIASATSSAEIINIRSVYNSEIKSLLRENENLKEWLTRTRQGGEDNVDKAISKRLEETKEEEEEKEKEANYIELEEKRAEYLKSQAIDTTTFTWIKIIKDIAQTEEWKNAIKSAFDASIDQIASYEEDTKPSEDWTVKLVQAWIGENFPLSFQKFKELLQIWSTNPDLSDFHTDINIAIQKLNEIADNNITK